MFDVMQSRWFYLSDEAVIGKHPKSGEIILVMRNGYVIPPASIKKILALNHMEVAGELVKEKGCIYFPLKEIDK
jgi:hypothetical protein